MTTAEEREQAANIDVPARQAIVAAILAEQPLNEQPQASIAPVDKKRKKRSDAGTKRPAAPQKPGVLSPEQVARLKDLIESRESRRAELQAAIDAQAHCLGAVDAATQAVDDYLLELQGKQQGRV